MNSKVITTLLIAFALTACVPDKTDAQAFKADRPDYYVVDENLTRIKADFNAMQDKVRLVFLIGPSCGICLRGMDDLNDAIVGSIQNDPRAHTLAIHVPTLGAKEEHAANSIPLLSGPRVTHYWDPSGNTGLAFQETLGIPMYAWDLWFVYEPGARWEAGGLPPHPDHWEHQLQGLPGEKRLDAGRFAAEVRTRLSRLPPAVDETRVTELRQRDAGIIPVAQPHGFMISQNHRSRGGYHTLKRIESIRYEGTIEAGDKTYPLTLITARPYRYERSVGAGDARFSVTWDGAEAELDGTPIGLPREYLSEMLASYEFDGWMTEWKDKGHELSRLGMKKVDDRLPWLLEAELANGRTWHVYVDSHTGDAFRNSLIGADGEETIRIDYADYKEADGFRLPHRIRYFEGDRLLATDRFSHIDVTMAAEDDGIELDESGAGTP